MKTLPMIHTNGTSAKMLFAGYNQTFDACRNAVEACRAALESMEGIEFNARDYYPKGPEAWTDARTEMAKHAAAIKDAQEAFLAVAVHVQQFIKE